MVQACDRSSFKFYDEVQFIGMDEDLFVCNDEPLEYITFEYCRPIPKKPTLTHAEICEKFGVDDFEIEVK